MPWGSRDQIANVLVLTYDICDIAGASRVSKPIIHGCFDVLCDLVDRHGRKIGLEGYDRAVEKLRRRGEPNNKIERLEFLREKIAMSKVFEGSSLDPGIQVSR